MLDWREFGEGLRGHRDYFLQFHTSYGTPAITSVCQVGQDELLVGDEFGNLNRVKGKSITHLASFGDGIFQILTYPDLDACLVAVGFNKLVFMSLVCGNCRVMAFSRNLRRMALQGQTLWVGFADSEIQAFDLIVTFRSFKEEPVNRILRAHNRLSKAGTSSCSALVFDPFEQHIVYSVGLPDK